MGRLHSKTRCRKQVLNLLRSGVHNDNWFLIDLKVENLFGKNNMFLTGDSIRWLTDEITEKLQQAEWNKTHLPHFL